MAGGTRDTDDINLAGRIAMFDPKGTLDSYCREIWTLIEADREEIARQFWIEYARSPDLPFKLDDSKLDELTRRIVPYVEAKYGRIADPAWVAIAADYVAAATNAKVPMTTLYAGIAA